MKLHFQISFFLLFISFYGAAQPEKIPAFVMEEQRAAAARMQMPQTAPTGNYDWIYQRLELFSDPRYDTIAGETTVYFRFYARDSIIWFDLNSALTVSEVLYHGQAVQFEQNDEDALQIRLPVAVEGGVIDSLFLRYSGRPQASGYGSFEVSTHDNVPIVWTLSEPYGAKDWWPCKQDLIDKLDSVDVIINYPAEINGEEMQGVSNGILVSETMEDGSKVSHWRHRYPIPAYLVAFAVTNYAHYSHEAGLYRRFPVDNYVYPEDSAWAAQNTPVTVDLMDFFEDKFGEYPFSSEKYGHAQFGWGGGMEHTTITFLGSFSRMLISHELAHQWYGDDVTCGSWSDIWLNEGFATYGEALTQEYFDGEDAFLNWRRYAMDWITSEPSGSVYVYGEDTLNVSRVFSWPLSYLKGAMVLHMLRFRTGDTLFYEILREYRNRYSFDYARTPDFQAVVEDMTGEDYTEFFQDWIYGKGYPSITAEWGATEDGYEVRLTQTTSDPSVSFFETPLPLRFLNSDTGAQLDTVVSWNINDQVFQIVSSENFDVLQVDPDYHIIRGDVEVMRVKNDLINSPFIIFPNPVNDILFVQPVKGRVISRYVVYDISGRKVAEYPAETIIIPMGNRPAGIYLLEAVEANGNRWTQKIIKW